MKYLYILIGVMISTGLYAQIDPALLRTAPVLTDSLTMNLEAVYKRPSVLAEKSPVALGGYAEANYQYLQTDGISEGHQFQMRRLTLFVSSSISKRIRFLTEIEFEDGAKEISLEFASLDFEFTPLFNLRGGVVMNPIGAFNQNHDGPKWEFIDRPIAATQMLPATWSNVGVGVYGKKSNKNWAFAYEVYASNGFDDRIIANSENKTFLPASKLNIERFEESFNGSPLLTAKIALRNMKAGELGISWMGGVYNKYQDDGIELDKKRRVDVFAIDFNTEIPRLKTQIKAEWACVKVDIPETYTEQFGKKQQGGYIDIVQPVLRRPMMGFEKSVLNLALRLQYVDWNRGKFISTGGNISDDIFSIVPAISWRPGPETVFRMNYFFSRQKDILGNPPARTGGFQAGFATYF